MGVPTIKESAEKFSPFRHSDFKNLWYGDFGWGFTSIKAREFSTIKHQVSIRHAFFRSRNCSTRVAGLCISAYNRNRFSSRLTNPLLTRLALFLFYILLFSLGVFLVS